MTNSLNKKMFKSINLLSVAQIKEVLQNSMQFFIEQY